MKLSWHGGLLTLAGAHQGLGMDRRTPPHVDTCLLLLGFPAPELEMEVLGDLPGVIRQHGWSHGHGLESLRRVPPGRSAKRLPERIS